MKKAGDTRLALDVEQLLVWTYRVQAAHVVIARGLGLRTEEARAAGLAIKGVSGCGVAVIDEIQRLGVRVDRSSGGSFHLHPDAETVAGMIELSSPLVRYAAAGERPDWMPKARPTWRPVMSARGRPELVYDPGDRHRNYGAWRVICSPAPRAIDQARADYVTWRRELGELFRALLLVRLLDHRVLPPRAPIDPWVAVEQKGLDAITQDH